MPDRIARLFAQCRKENRAAFIAYVCAGDPDFPRTLEIAGALEAAGVDLLELGVPFSDPLADGIVNQMAAQRALEAGATVRGVLECVRAVRAQSEIPIVLYTYLNPMVQFGLDAFYREAEAAGVDGLLILDLPPDEDVELHRPAIAHIRLVAPTTSGVAAQGNLPARRGLHLLRLARRRDRRANQRRRLARRTRGRDSRAAPTCRLPLVSASPIPTKLKPWPRTPMAWSSAARLSTRSPNTEAIPISPAKFAPSSNRSRAPRGAKRGVLSALRMTGRAPHARGGPPCRSWTSSK